VGVSVGAGGGVAGVGGDSTAFLAQPTRNITPATEAASSKDRINEDFMIPSWIERRCRVRFQMKR
jgi:hypothetical protein